MNIAAEKAEIIKRVGELDDSSVVHAIKEFMDDMTMEHEEDEEFKAAIEAALIESDNREGRPHEEVMREFRSKYGT